MRRSKSRDVLSFGFSDVLDDGLCLLRLQRLNTVYNSVSIKRLSIRHLLNGFLIAFTIFSITQWRGTFSGAK